MTYNTDMDDDEAAADLFAYDRMGLKVGNRVTVDSIQRYEEDFKMMYEGRLVQITENGVGLIEESDNEFVFIPWTSCALVRMTM
jgi:hypothetical protein